MPDACNGRLWNVILVSLLVFWSLPAGAQWVAPVAIEVRDNQGRLLTRGEISICPEGSDCQAFPLSPEGVAHVGPSALLEPEITLLVKDPNGRSLFAVSGWSITRADRWLLENRPERVRGFLRGTAEMGLKLKFEDGEPPVMSAGRAPSRGYLAGGGHLLGGEHFGDAEGILGGGLELRPGWGIMLGRRFGLPTSWPAYRGVLRYLDCTLSYATARYRVGPVGPYDERDLSWHRATLGLGPGWAGRHTRFSLQGLVGWSGVYDGTEVLEQGDRRYSMPAFGLGGRLTRNFLDLGGRHLGLCAEGSLLYIAADHLEGDHWYGLAPSLILGLSLE